MPNLDHEIAGLRCRDVLAELSNYLDHLLSPERLAAVQAHLAACPVCARFGGDVSAILSALRPGSDVADGDSASGHVADGEAGREMGVIPEPITPAALHRLRAAIGQVTAVTEER